MTAWPQFTRIETEAALLQLEAEWRALFAAAGSPSPFLDFDWVLMCWRQVARRGGTPLLVTVREDGRLVLAIALERRRYRRLFWRYHSLSDHFPQEDDALIHPVGEASAWLRALRRALRRSWRDGSIILTFVTAHSALGQLALRHEVARFFARGMLVDLRPGYAAYLARFNGPTRAQIRRAERQLDPAGATLRLATPDTFDADLGWLLDMKRRWQPPEGRKLRSWLTDRPSEADLRDLGRRWIETGQLRLALLETGGRRVAGGLLFAAGTTLMFYATTYDPVAARASPGRLIALRMIEWAAANGYETLDLMSGEWSWKERIMTADYVQYRIKLPLWGWLR